MEIKSFESPKEFVQYLNDKQEMLKTPSGIGSWYWRAKMFYDPNVCGCKKKNMSDQIIEQGYRSLLLLPENEKMVARSIVGGNFTLKINGEFIGTV